MPACSPGEQYSRLSDGRIVCGPDCGMEAEATAAGTCQCLRAGTVFDAPTRTCGCGPKQVDVSNGMGPAQCKPACDPGQQYTQAANGAFACTCTHPGMVPDPTTHLCRCPTGTSLIDGQCSIPCPVLLGPDGKCPTAKRTGVICKNGLAPLDNAKCPVSKKASTKVVPKAPKISGPTFSIGPGLLQLGNGLFNGGNRKSSSDSNNNLNAPNNNQLFKGGK